MIKKGTIVLIPFPFTDLSGQKMRPAVVVSDVQDGDDVLVVFISSKKSRRKNRFELVVFPDEQNGLKIQSIIKCSKIATLDKKVIIGELGKLNRQYISDVNKKLKLLFGL